MPQKVATFTFAISLINSALIFSSYGHERHMRNELDSKSLEKKNKDALTKINNAYIGSVRPIFEKKCFDCHGSKTNYPWYYPIPGIKQIIDGDIAESKEHLDMTNNFPFKGHGSPEEDLKAIQKVTQEKSMPPFRYWIMHWDKKLSLEDQKSILEWTDYSLEKLKALPSPKPGPSTPPEAETQK